MRLVRRAIDAGTFTLGWLRRKRRIKLDKAPWTADKLWRKSLKQFVWIVFSLWTGLSFVGFFVPIAVDRTSHRSALSGLVLGGFLGRSIVYKRMKAAAAARSGDAAR